jgi:hypothetical protein
LFVTIKDEAGFAVVFSVEPIVVGLQLTPETHTKRQETQHGCLPSRIYLLGDGDKGILK